MARMHPAPVVTNEPVIEVGGCNFCDRGLPRVYVVRDGRGGISVRFCLMCLSAVWAGARTVAPRLRPANNETNAPAARNGAQATGTRRLG